MLRYFAIPAWLHNARSVVVLLDIWWILENLLRQHLSHPTNIQFCLIHTQRDVRTLVTKLSGYLKLAWRIMIMHQTRGCDTVLGGKVILLFLCLYLERL
jgi:hypothetical protein